MGFCIFKSIPMAPSGVRRMSTPWRLIYKLLLYLHVSFVRSVCFQMTDHLNVLPESPRCKVDLEHMLGIVGIVGTVLNLLVVVLVYVYTPVWQGYRLTAEQIGYSESPGWRNIKIQKSQAFCISCIWWLYTSRIMWKMCIYF